MSLKTLALKRSNYIQKIRDFFKSIDFIEVETPIMVKTPGMEPHLNPFETSFISIHGEKTPVYLNHSPELQMKKLLGKGFERIFNLTKVFRNGEYGGGLHNPEFTMLEWYRQKADYLNIMKDTENLITSLAKNSTIEYQGEKIDLTPPWPKISVHELFLKKCNIDLLENKDFDQFKKTAEQKGHDTKGCQDWDDIFFKIFLNHIEPDLGKNNPVFIYDYPASQAALAKKSSKNPFWAERFELYIGGLELANAFSELIDAKEQRTRLLSEQKLRKKLKKTVFAVDEEFLSHLESIQHPCAGIALGIDRLLMILLNKKNIEEVLLFPFSQIIDN